MSRYCDICSYVEGASVPQAVAQVWIRTATVREAWGAGLDDDGHAWPHDPLLEFTQDGVYHVCVDCLAEFAHDRYRGRPRHEVWDETLGRAFPQGVAAFLSASAVHGHHTVRAAVEAWVMERLRVDQHGLIFGYEAQSAMQALVGHINAVVDRLCRDQGWVLVSADHLTRLDSKWQTRPLSQALEEARAEVLARVYPYRVPGDDVALRWHSQLKRPVVVRKVLGVRWAYRLVPGALGENRLCGGTA